MGEVVANGGYGFAFFYLVGIELSIANHIQILTNNRKQIENRRMVCYDI